MSQKITSFLKRLSTAPNETVKASGSTPKKLNDLDKKPVSASLKTVQKWQRELNIDLKIDMGDLATVTQMTCKTCKMYGPSDSSSKNWPGDTVISIPNCQVCKRLQSLVVQLYCCLDKSRYHRTLYMFACTDASCWNKEQSWTVYRCQSEDDSFQQSITYNNSRSAVKKHMSKYPDVKDMCTAADDWGVAADDWGVAADDWVAGGDDWGKVAADCGEGADDWDEGTNDWGEGADEFCDVDEDTHDGVDGTRYKEITAKIDSEPTDRESPSQDRNKNQCSSMVDATHYTALKQLCLNDVTDDVIDECQANTSHVVGEDIPSCMSELERSNIFQSFHVSDSAENGTDNVLRSYHINVFEEPAGLAEDNDHVSKLLKDYQKREGSNVKEMLKDLSFEGGGAMEKYERSALFHKDFVFHKFIKRLSVCPEQCIRYQWNGSPLLCGSPPSSLPRRCRYCGGEVVFELQLTPALINCLKFPQRIEPALEFGTVLVYTCRQSCWDNSVSYRTEYSVVQPDPDQHLFK